jgi:hypothetical protein
MVNSRGMFSFGKGEGEGGGLVIHSKRPRKQFFPICPMFYRFDHPTGSVSDFRY